MGFANIARAAAAEATEGRFCDADFHKTSTPVLPSAGAWADMSMGAGKPKFNAYVGDQLTLTPFVGQGNNGLVLPNIASPQTLHLQDLQLISTTATFMPATFVLADYLACVPLIDFDSTDLQLIDNPSPLPRYPSGQGVRMALVTTTPQTSVAAATVTYTNTQGVPGRVSTIYTAATNTGNLQAAQAVTGAATSQSPALPLMQQDNGISQVNSIQLNASAGGFCALLLYRPIAQARLREAGTPSELSFLQHRRSLPRVEQGAMLNFLYTSGQAAPSTVVRGSARFIWS